MTTDIFYAILKLVSGEELVSKVCAFIENDEVLIVLDNPIIVNIVNIPNMRVPLVKVEPWMSLIEDQTYIINRKDIITMNEVKDLSLVRIHQQYLRYKNKKTNETKITSGMGYVSSLKTAREQLEKLYQSQDIHSKFE